MIWRRLRAAAKLLVFVVLLCSNVQTARGFDVDCSLDDCAGDILKELRLLVVTEEEADAGTTVVTFTISDAEGTVGFSLDSKSAELLQLSTPTVNGGEVTVAVQGTEALDREETPVILFTISAFPTTFSVSEGKYVENTESEKDSKVNLDVIIALTDINDNAPAFSQDDLPANVLEDAADNARVTYIDVEDPDSGKNKEFELSILSGNDDGYFKLGDANDILVAKQGLDRESGTQKFVLTIQGKGKGKK